MDRMPMTEAAASPATTTNQESPAVAEKDETPAVDETDKSTPSAQKDESPASADKDKSPGSAEKVESPQSVKDAKQAQEQGGYDFRCGQVLLATPYGQRQLHEYGVRADDIRQSLGFDPAFMAQCFRTALAAQPLDKLCKPFASRQDYEARMHNMVSQDQIKRLGAGWMPWAEAQASEWENMVDSQPHDKAIQIQKVLGQRVEDQWSRHQGSQ